ncbi:PP2C family protein-serine/threonine phosphatase [Streptacidiphilus sp. MAP5-3]|uniref:PP2C family protein-serine/threonine phosphatase n=1 Tax=unclassified Streptacidiphilus TaxID=2643834 RepID=UPI003512F5C8
MGAEVPPRDAVGASMDAAALAMGVNRDALLSALVTDLPFGVALLDGQLACQYVNETFVRLTGTDDPRTIAAVADAAHDVLQDGIARVGDYGAARLRVQRLDLEPDSAASTEGAASAEAEGAEATARAGVLVLANVDDEEAVRTRARLSLLTSAGARIGTTLDIDTTCTELARFTVPTLADLAAVDILPPGAPDHRLGAPLGSARLLRAAVAGTPELHPQLATLAHPGETVRHRDGSAVARSLAAAKPVAVTLRTEEDLAVALSDEHSRSVFRAAGIAAMLALPLSARGHLLGALVLARAGEREFSDAEIAMIEDLADRAALSIDNARRYMRSQGIALELQRALLAEPANPHPNLEIACRYLPSGTSSVVGGDWYETVRLPFGRTLLVIGDVMGHGVEAAVDMSTYRSMLRYVAGADLPPHRILRQLDSLISENEAARPATCLLALLEPSRNRVTFSSAGHLPPALVTPGRPTELLALPSGPPLGTGVGGYEHLVRELLPGQVLLLYTDGLVERRHEDIDVSLERLAALPLPAAGELDDLLDAVLHSSDPAQAEDDIALLAARVVQR